MRNEYLTFGLMVGLWVMAFVMIDTTWVGFLVIMVGGIALLTGAQALAAVREIRKWEKILTLGGNKNGRNVHVKSVHGKRG